MTQKYEITKLVLESQGIVADDKRIKKTIPVWWINPRKKAKGGLGLTEQGFECLQNADIKVHKIRFEQPVQITNQLILWIDNFIDCPFYLTKKEIYVFGEKMAVQLVLFSGDIAKFTAAKAKNLKSA